MADKIILSKSIITDIGNAIREKEESNDLIPSVEMAQRIRRIETGLDTTDATATPNDILLGKTAYAKGEKIEGSIETYDGEFEGEAKESKSLKGYLDIKKSAENLFSSAPFSTMTSEQLVEFLPTYDTTENVTNMTNMFNGCAKLTTIPLFDTSKVTNMNSSFANCPSLTTIPLFDTSACTSMTYVFSSCKNLTSVPQLDLSKCTDLTYFFSGCSNLTSVPQLDTSVCTNMTGFYYNCPSLTSVPQLDTSVCTNMSNLFRNCSKLQKIDISHFNISSTSYSSRMCYYCYSLKAFIIRSFGSNYVLDTNSFTNCYHMLGITNATYNPNGDHDGYVYVPREYIEILSNSTNWSVLQFRALEDYTKDGTTTGEFDDEKAGLL